MMNRRRFLSHSAIATISLPGFSLLSGCGGGGGDGMADSTSEVDLLVGDLSTAYASSDATHTALNRETELLLGGETAANAPAFAPAGSAASTAAFFAATLPSPSSTSPVAALYLDRGGEKTMWEHYRAYQALAQEQFNHQYTKLLAAMRTADYRMQQRTPGAIAAVSEAGSEAESNLDDSDREKIDTIEELIDYLAQSYSGFGNIFPYDTFTGAENATESIVTGFPKGANLAQWLLNVGGSTTLGQLDVLAHGD